MIKARRLSVLIVMVLFSVLALGCNQRTPARSQLGQASDGWTPSSMYDAPVTLKKMVLEQMGLGDKKSKDKEWHFGAIEAKMREPVKLGETIFVVYGVRDVSSDVITAPTPGNKFIAVEVSITNIGKKTRYFAGVRDLWLRDMKGRKITNDGVRPVESINFLDAGATGPGQMIRGEVNFEVPDDEDQFDLHFEPVTLDLGEWVVVKLTRDDSWRPAGSEIPASLEFDMPGPRPEE